MRSAVHRLAERWWYGRPRPPALLRPLAALYGAWTSGRLERPSARPPVPVIVVGNLTAGGSGKTPVVEALVRLLTDDGLRVGVISRGYGGEEPVRPLEVTASSTARRVGDEPLALHRATGVPVWVCRHRASALAAAVAHGSEVVISDDGLQHVALARSFELCVIDGRRGFGNGALLPAGPLRQPVQRLDRVDAVLVKAPVVVDLPGAFEDFELVPSGWSGVAGRPVAPPDRGWIDAVAGIADPEAFFESLEAMGYRLRRHPLADHQVIDPDWLSGLRGPVVVTAKDAARLDADTRPDLFVARVEARLPESLRESVRAHVREFSS